MKTKKVRAASARKPVKSQQWAKVHQFREQLETKFPPPPMRRLRSVWEVIEREQRRGSLENLGFTCALDAVMYCIKDGSYPPPEILLALEEGWIEYLRAKGTVSLEEALIGRPKRRAGNYARQAFVRSRNLCLTILLLAVRREQGGIRWGRAATWAVHEFDLAIEPGSLVDIARSVTNEAVEAVSRHYESKSVAAEARMYLRGKWISEE
jgi:hypothetical protein